jgi:hypothetical protein
LNILFQKSLISTQQEVLQIVIGLEGKGEKSVLKLPFQGKSSSLMMKEKPQTLITGVSETTMLNDEEEPSINQSFVDCSSFVDVDEDENVSNLCVEVCAEKPERVENRKGQLDEDENVLIKKRKVSGFSGSVSSLSSGSLGSRVRSIGVLETEALVQSILKSSNPIAAVNNITKAIHPLLKNVMKNYSDSPVQALANDESNVSISCSMCASQERVKRHRDVKEILQIINKFGESNEEKTNFLADVLSNEELVDIMNFL